MALSEDGAPALPGTRSAPAEEVLGDVSTKTLWFAASKVRIIVARVARERKCAVLVSIKFRDVDIDEPHGRVLERGLRRAGKIAVARANTDDQIRFSGQNVRSWRNSASIFVKSMPHPILFDHRRTDES